MGRGTRSPSSGTTSPEWVIAELAAQCAGGFGTGIYQDSILKEVAYIINHSETKFVIAEDQEQVDKILDMQEELPGVKKVIYYDPKGMGKYPSDLLAHFPDVIEMGRKYEKDHPGAFEKNVENTGPDDVAWICTTSGTTGVPEAGHADPQKLDLHGDQPGQGGPEIRYG